MVFCVYEVLNGWIGSRFIFFLPHVFGDSFCGSEAKTRQKLGSTTTKLCASIIIRGLEDGGNIRAPDPYGGGGGRGGLADLVSCCRLNSQRIPECLISLL